MSRMRALLPALLLSSLAVPAVAGEYSICLTAASSLSCVIEQAEFAYQRNLEIDASSATVARVRAFEAARNAEIAASIAAVHAERDRQLAVEQNALSAAATLAANAERDRRFAAAQNALARQSIAAVEAARARDLALSLTYCKSADDTSARCEAERAGEFAAHQNALAAASSERVNAIRERQFAARQNALATFASHAADTERARVALKASERSDELALSLTHCTTTDDASPRCEVERAREFAAARNAEINSARAAYETARALRLAETPETNGNTPVDANAGQPSPMDTGALGIPATSPQSEPQPEPERILNHRVSAEPCRAAGQPLDAVQFSGPDLAINATMKPALDRLVSIAQACPDVRIELHGHSDAGNSAFISRSLALARAQAAADYLIGAGIAANRLAVISHGAQQPLVANTNAANRARNRRIEFSVKDPAMQAAMNRVMWDLAELLDPTYVPQVAGLSP